MSSIDFNYEGNIINIHCNSNEKMSDIIKKFILKVGKKKEDLYFFYGGDILKENLTFNEQSNKNDRKRNKMSILVNNKEEEEESSLKKSQYIICPKCQESARILVENYKIKIYGCKNGHKSEYILIQDFDKSQMYDEVKIKCQQCNKSNKSISYNNNFFICFDCKKNICQLCKTKHDKGHNIINYDDKFFTCDIHYESFNTYCSDCKKDICISCEMEHSGHKNITYGSILPNLKKIQEEKNEFFNKKEALKSDINDIIDKLKNLINNIDNYFAIYEDIINSYGNKKRNYFLLQNIHDMTKFNNSFITDFDSILKEKDIHKKTSNIIDIYYKFSQVSDQNKDKLNQSFQNDKSFNNPEKSVKNISSEDNEKIDAIYQELSETYGIDGFLDEDAAKQKIIELKYNKDAVINWIENNLLFGDN